MFGTDIRIIIPHIAMSCGTMIACSGKEIIMGKHSNLGPIDPQFSSISADGVIEEFERAKREVKDDPSTVPIWQIILSKYRPAFIGDCEKAIIWAKEIVKKWLETGMFAKEKDSEAIIKVILEKLSSHKETSSHARHISSAECSKIGLNVIMLESLGEKMQDLVLTVHHCFMHTFASTEAIKIIENHDEKAIVSFHRNK